MIDLSGRVAESVAYVAEKIVGAPRIGLILGSGLGAFADALQGTTVIEMTAIPHFPRPGVLGHRGRVIFATIRGVPVLAFQGRPHVYETGDPADAVYPIRIAYGLGIRSIILTNAAGGVNRSFVTGDLMAITDQMNLTGIPPFAAGILGARPGMLYSRSLLQTAHSVAAALRLRLHQGVYVGVKGPSYETPAEVEMVFRLGGDAVGMSTVLEAALAGSLGMQVLGLSCITNMAAGIRRDKLDHGDVTLVGQRVQQHLTELLRGIITAMGSEGKA
jgi:purine-nucleoside phosphorylase